jgi:hypothetical protein
MAIAMKGIFRGLKIIAQIFSKSHFFHLSISPPAPGLPNRMEHAKFFFLKKIFDKLWIFAALTDG